MRPHLILLLVVPLTGCASFLIHPEDPTTAKVAKLVARVPTAVISVGFSEMFYFCARNLDPQAFRGDSDALVRWARLTSEERLSMCIASTDWSGSSGRGTAWRASYEHYEPSQQQGDEKLKRRVEQINREAQAWQEEQNRAAERDQKLQQQIRRIEEQQKTRQRMQP